MASVQIIIGYLVINKKHICEFEGKENELNKFR